MRCWTLRGQLRAAAIVPSVLIVTFLVGSTVVHEWWSWRDHVVDERNIAEGRAEAERDIAAGKMKHKVYTYVMCGGAGWLYARPVLEPYGLEFELVKLVLDQPSSGSEARTKAYNKRIEEELDRKFGAGTAERIRNAMRELESQGLLYGHPPP
jgi:hypothetical protein